MKYETKEDNKWCIYYRKVIENDEIILPEVTNKEELTKLMEKDPWTAMTQYFNNPTEAGMTELNLYTIHECRLDFTEEKGWMIDYMEGEDNRVISLSDCYVVQACDPAASEKGFHAKTSRSAVGVLAHAADDKRFLIALNVDFVAASRMFDWMFSNAIKFDGYLQKTVLEAQGAFKILNSILRNEENRRRTEAYVNGQKFAYLNLQSVNKAGEKDAVIRSSLDPLLRQNLLYVDKNLKTKVLEELNTFPQSPRKDILDMLSLAINSTIRPLDEREIKMKRRRDNRFYNRMANAAGY
jgi:phage terminase large subunit-like protein